MSQIPEIQSNDIRMEELRINEIRIPDILTWNTDTSIAIPPSPPVTTQVGIPIIDMPGCVEAHEVNEKDNFKINEDDPKGVKTFCDAGVPSFNPIDYNKDELELTGERPIPEYKAESPKKESSEPVTNAVEAAGKVTTAIIECPTQEQLSKEPVGFIFDSGRKEITGYRLEGTQCIREVRDVPIVQQALNGLPPTGIVITTGGIAVVATTSALLAKPFADILLKVIKPTVKKVLKKIAQIRGKKPKVESVSDRRAEQRLRNEAIAKLRSVAAKSQKKK